MLWAGRFSATMNARLVDPDSEELLEESPGLRLGWGMSRRFVALMAAGTAMLTVVASASATSPLIYQATKSGPGAWVNVVITKHYSAYILSVTTRPSGLPIDVDWTVANTGRGGPISRKNYYVHSPYRRLVHSVSATSEIEISTKLSTTVPGGTGSPVSGQISLIVSAP